MQCVLKALLPHATSIRTLEGSSDCSGSDKFCQEALARWETFWLCLPALQHLVWAIPSCGLMLLEDEKAFGLPSTLMGMMLAIAWDHYLGDAKDFDLSTLEAREYHGKTTDLTFAVIQAIHKPAKVSLGDQEWPMLGTFKCISEGFSGKLNAPNLVVIKLDIGSARIKWQAFSLCRQLQTIRVTGQGGRGSLDCRSCTFPDTLEHLYLSVRSLHEDGCFTQDFSSLRTMHASFRVGFSSKVDLRGVTSKQQSMDVSVDQGILALWMPPEHDAVWQGSSSQT